MDRVTQEHEELTADLKATLAARRELGPEMDDELAGLFLARVDAYIESRVSGQVVNRIARMRERPLRPSGPPRVGPALLTLVLVLLAGSVVFGAHVHAFPIVALVVLLIVFVRHRSCNGNSNPQRP